METIAPLLPGILAGPSEPEARSVDRRLTSEGLDRGYDQFMTPEWAAQRIVERCGLRPDDRVVDAGCGKGAFLKAVPPAITAMGVEIDPKLAAFAEDDTGRDVIVGDYRLVDLPFRPTFVIGNPPYNRAIANGFLERSADALVPDGRMALLMLSSFFSFASTLDRWREQFSIEHEALPRDLFPTIKFPLSLFLFTKNGARRLTGFFLFDEAAAMRHTPKNIKLVLTRGRRRTSVWRAAVTAAMEQLGGRATLAQLYGILSGNKPRAIETWRDTVRRVLQEGGFERVGAGEWRVASA